MIYYITQDGDIFVFNLKKEKCIVARLFCFGFCFGGSKRFFEVA